MIFVTVIEPRNREIYVNGVYSHPLGPTPTLVMLEAGAHIVQMLTPGPGKRLVDFEGEVSDTSDYGNVTIDLAPVEPPRSRDS
ncbi:hypothetical protein BH11PSE3_BH11PSE3_45480 [soil metagenome]